MDIFKKLTGELGYPVSTGGVPEWGLEKNWGREWLVLLTGGRSLVSFVSTVREAGIDACARGTRGVNSCSFGVSSGGAKKRF